MLGSMRLGFNLKQSQVELKPEDFKVTGRTVAEFTFGALGLEPGSTRRPIGDHSRDDLEALVA